MRNAIRKAREGFTLIELMIVVAIIGVLAVLAIVGVRKFIANAKTAEAKQMIGQIGKDAESAYNNQSMAGTVLAQGGSTTVNQKLCGSASATVPSAIGNVKGKKYQSSVAEWNADAATNAGFACLKFTIDKPQYYMYNYTLTGTGSTANDSYTATANGDLNGDGIQSTFQQSGQINSSMVLNVSPAIIETNPEE